MRKRDHSKRCIRTSQVLQDKIHTWARRFWCRIQTFSEKNGFSTASQGEMRNKVNTNTDTHNVNAHKVNTHLHNLRYIVHLRWKAFFAICISCGTELRLHVELAQQTTSMIQIRQRQMLSSLVPAGPSCQWREPSPCYELVHLHPSAEIGT